MQVMWGSSFAEQADDNRFRREVIPARRGIIRDRTGAVLAQNEPSFQVDMRWTALPPDAAARDATIATVARIIGVPATEITEALASKSAGVMDEWVPIAWDVAYDRAVALQVHLPSLSGVSLIAGAKRQYPQSTATPSLSHVLGYVGPVSPAEYADHKASGYRRNDEIGKTGVERSHEATLRGVVGERRTEVDALGYPHAVVSDTAPKDGKDLWLTLDLSLQKTAEQALREELDRTKIKRGSVVVMDVTDGSVLAMVSLPSYDNTLFAGAVSSTAYQALLADEEHPLFPRAWAGQFPSGSTIKPLIATAALAEGVITPNTTVLSTGGIHVGPWFFPDWRAGGHGRVSVREAIAWSINTFFYYVGGGYGEFIGLGVDRLTSWMRHFQLGTPTGVDLPGEASGHVPSQAWKEETKGERWYIGDTYNLSIGQGDLLVTPLQMARITAAIANGGTLVVPHVAQTSSTAVFPTLDVSPSVLETVRQGMRETVTYGSGRALASLPIPVAGKTGTAQWRADKPNHAWFIGFAPVQQPKIAIVVLLEEGIGGDRHAVPVAGKILRAWAAE
jgi:penicillin-binding protein 2